jgi:hypothetical protein
MNFYTINFKFFFVLLSQILFLNTLTKLITHFKNIYKLLKNRKSEGMLQKINYKGHLNY